MASKMNPWRSLCSLAIRTQPSGPQHPFPSAAARSAVPLGRRGLTDHPSMQGPPNNGYSSGTAPPPPPFDRSLHNRPFADNFLNAQAVAALEQEAAGLSTQELTVEGLKFGMPAPPAKRDRLQDRHHPVIHQVTRMLMRDGKLSKAQKHLSLILNYLRTSPPPNISPRRPLVPGAPPAEQLPLNPLTYLTVAIDSVAPIVRIRSLKGMAGGGAALEVPEPMRARARRRQAILWILDIVNKKRSMGSGRKQFAARFGSEIVAVVEGRSPAWDRRQIVHKMGTSSRANLVHPALMFKGRRR